MTIMPVPETAMNQHYSLSFRKNQIRFSGKLAVMQAVAEAERVQRLANNKFRLGVLAPDARHHPAANIGRNNISH